MKLLGPELQREAECEAVLRSLPMWFGIEESLLMDARDSGRLPTFALEEESHVVGFLSLQEHLPLSWEVHCVAIAAAARNRGYGMQLLTHAEHWFKAQGVRVLQIKTVSASSPSTHYAQTRQLYASRGYFPVEEFPLLWSPRNPALQLIKVLSEA